MGKKTYAPIIAIAITLTVLLFVPMLPYSTSGTEAVDYSASIASIKLTVGVDSSNIRIQYATSPTAQLINVTWDYTIYHPILGFPSLNATLTNSTAGTTLFVTFEALNTGFSLVNFVPTSQPIIFTINPTLLTNLSVNAGSGNIEIITTNFQNKTFGKVSLACASGNILSDFINGSIFTGDLSLGTGSGNIDLDVGASSELQERLITNTLSGNTAVNLGNGTILNKNFNIGTGSGNSVFTATNLSLNNKEITGIMITDSGSCRAILTQRSVLSGNLTLDMNTGSGNCYLVMNYANTAIGSKITTGIFDTVIGSPTGFTGPVGGVYTSTVTLSSNINVDIQTGSGNTYLQGGYS